VLLKLLEKLTEACGVSGNEHEIRKILINEITPHVDKIKTDHLGNLLAIKHGKEDYPRIMLAAHMDEVGFMVKSIDDSGLIKFMPVGGIDDRILISKVVQIGKNKIKGVIGAKAIHLQEPDERKTPLKSNKLYIDIGAQSKEEAEKLVKKGDYVSFVSQYEEFGDNLIKAKALDDRVGCAILAELLKKQYNATIIAAFTVQEEIGLRGAGVAAYAANPDIAIVIEGTTCYDITDIEEPDYVTRLNHGPALSILDSVSYSDKNIRGKLTDVAAKNNIKFQWKQGTTGGNDAGSIHLTKDGIPTASISIPCRYIHSPISVMHKNDFVNCLQLIQLFLENVQKEEFIYES
jgi:putative aminopeptidase FrvX